jgi:hemerythrin
VLSGNNNNIDEVHKLLGEIYNSIAKMEIENEGSAII